MYLSLVHLKVLMSFLESSNQTLQSITDITVVSDTKWNFVYKDLDGELYSCSLVSRGSVSEEDSVVFSSDSYELDIVVNKSYS